MILTSPKATFTYFLHSHWRILRPLVLLGVLLNGGIITANAQVKVKYLANYDHKPTHFGFLLGMGQTNYSIKLNQSFYQSSANNKYVSIASPPTTFIRLGGLVNRRLNERFDFRILPTVSIYSRNLALVDTVANTPDNDDIFRPSDKAWLEIPVAIKYKSERRRNLRMYAFGGFRYGWETNATKDGSNLIINTKNNDFSIEYGFGLEGFMRYFKLTPEIHFSHGLKNMIQPTTANNSIARPAQYIDRMRTHNVTLMLMFE